MKEKKLLIILLFIYRFIYCNTTILLILYTMDTITVSPKFQVVIPKRIREHLSIKPGEKMVIVEKNNTISLIPVGRLKDARGIAKGVTTKNLRNESERHFD